MAEVKLTIKVKKTWWLTPALGVIKLAAATRLIGEARALRWGGWLMPRGVLTHDPLNGWKCLATGGWVNL